MYEKEKSNGKSVMRFKTCLTAKFSLNRAIALKIMPFFGSRLL